VAAAVFNGVSKLPPAPQKHLELGGDALSFVEEPQKTPGSDAYNQENAKPSTAVDGRKTRSPLDVRRASETIKGSRTWDPPKAGANPRLAALCSDLERVLSELALLTDPPGQKTFEFRGRMAHAGRLVEEAIDCLLAEGP
jgi:hypothetical protein